MPTPDAHSGSSVARSWRYRSYWSASTGETSCGMAHPERKTRAQNRRGIGPSCHAVRGESTVPGKGPRKPGGLPFAFPGRGREPRVAEEIERRLKRVGSRTSETGPGSPRSGRAGLLVPLAGFSYLGRPFSKLLNEVPVPAEFVESRIFRMAQGLRKLGHGLSAVGASRHPNMPTVPSSRDDSRPARPHQSRPEPVRWATRTCRAPLPPEGRVAPELFAD